MDMSGRRSVGFGGETRNVDPAPENIVRRHVVKRNPDLARAQLKPGQDLIVEFVITRARVIAEVAVEPDQGARQIGAHQHALAVGDDRA